jgi:predicted Zn-dependent protease
MAFYVKEKKYSDAEKILIEAVRSGNTSNIIKYYLVQVYLMQGKTNESIELIKSLDEYKSYRAGLVNERFS